MTLGADEFMRRSLLHVLTSGFHRIRHYGLIANAGRPENLARLRELLHVIPEAVQPQPPDAPAAICGFPALRSSEVDSADSLHRGRLQLP